MTVPAALFRSVPVRRLFFAGVCFVVFGGAGYFASTFMDKAYRATTTASIVNAGDASSLLNGIGSQLGGLAALVGLDAQGGGAGSAKSMAVLRSRVLADKFLLDHGVVQQFCSLRLIRCIDGYATEPEPRAVTLRRAGQYFSDNVLSIAQDQRLQLVEVSITWFDRATASQWANDYLKLADDELRREAISEAQSRRAFLERAVQATSVLGVQQAIFRVLESQVNAEMMASTRADYAFHVVDPAVPADPRTYVRPQKAVIGLVAGLLAVGVFYLLVALRGKMDPGQ